jgi:hypothetical protein
MILNSPYITGSLTVTGNATIAGNITVTGSLSGTAATASFALTLGGTGSVGFATTGAFSATSGSASSRLTQIEQVYATTGSNSFRATQSITGSLTVTGQIVAQTLNVQQVTSSIVYSSGSNTFGCDLNSRQTFTGSFYQTGSIAYFGGNVGIGTTTTDCYIGYSVLQAQGTSGAIIQTSDGSVKTALVSNSTGFGIVGTRTNHGLKLHTNDIERMLITNCGNVGIGTCCADRRLTINSGASEGSLGLTSNNGVEIDMVGFGTGFSHPQIRIKLIDDGLFGGNLTISTKPNGSQTNALSERMRITSAGIACFSCQVCSPRFQADNFGIFRASSFRGGLYTYDAITGAGTDYSPTIFSEGGTGGGNFYITTGGSVTINMAMFCSGITCFRCQICAQSGVRFGNGSSTINYYCSADWAPQFYAGGSTSFGLSSQTGTGKFTRIGNVVTLHGQIAWTGGGSGGASLLSIQNLPFPAASSARGGVSPGIISGISQIASGGLNMVVEIATCIIYFTTNCGNGGPHIHLTGDAVTSGGSRLFSFGGSYITNDAS